MPGSVGVILNSREDWTPSVDPSTELKEEVPEISVKIKGRWDDDTLDSRQPSQANWIRQYVEQQQEVRRHITLAYFLPEAYISPNKMLKLSLFLFFVLFLFFGFI